MERRIARPDFLNGMALGVAGRAVADGGRPLAAGSQAPAGARPITVNVRRVTAFFDVHVVFNTNAEQASTTTAGASWLRPVAITPPRTARIGVRFAR